MTVRSQNLSSFGPAPGGSRNLKPWKPKSLRGCYLACAWLAGLQLPKPPPSSRRRGVRPARASQPAIV